MSLRIVRHAPEYMAAVGEFNRRLAVSGRAPGFALPEIPGPGQFVAVEGGAVRGGYSIHDYDFWIAGAVRRVGHYTNPLSEGILDRRYAALGAMLLKHALAIQPLLYALGMGGFDQPLPRMLQSMGWRVRTVPFLFYVQRPARFLRNIRPLRRSALPRLCLDLAAATGLGAIGIRLLQRRRAKIQPGITAQPFQQFGAWAEELWQRARDSYFLSMIRDAQHLAALYPPGDNRYQRLRILEHGKVVGWVVALASSMRNHPYFGDLQVGAILDGVALPEQTQAVAAAAHASLADADLVISNQAHAHWIGALRRLGFLAGPSNYLLATSRELTRLIEPLAEHESQLHFNRGDGDGRIHLFS